jgi:hypothetical protein
MTWKAKGRHPLWTRESGPSVTLFQCLPSACIVSTSLLPTVNYRDKTP